MRTLQDACAGKDCGEHGSLVDCVCVCDDGWVTASTTIANTQWCSVNESPPNPPGVISTPPLAPPRTGITTGNATEPPEPPTPLVQPVIIPAPPVEVSVPGVPGIGLDTGLDRSYVVMAALALLMIGCICWRRRVATQSSKRNRKRRRSEWVPEGNGYCSDSDGSSNNGSRSRSPAPRRPPRSPRKRSKPEKRYRRRESTDSDVSASTSSIEEHYHTPDRRSPARHGKSGTSSKSSRSGRPGSSGKSGHSSKKGRSSRSKSSHTSRGRTRD